MIFLGWIFGPDNVRFFYYITGQWVHSRADCMKIWPPSMSPIPPPCP